MQTAITIGPDGPEAHDATISLWNAGYHTIFRAESAQEACSLRTAGMPSLVMVLPSSPLRSSETELMRLRRNIDAPVIVPAKDAYRALKCLGPSITATETSAPDRSSWTGPLQLQREKRLPQAA